MDQTPSSICKQEIQMQVEQAQEALGLDAGVFQVKLGACNINPEAWSKNLENPNTNTVNVNTNLGNLNANLGNTNTNLGNPNTNSGNPDTNLESLDNSETLGSNIETRNPNRPENSNDINTNPGRQHINSNEHNVKEVRNIKEVHNVKEVHNTKEAYSIQEPQNIRETRINSNAPIKEKDIEPNIKHPGVYYGVHIPPDVQAQDVDGYIVLEDKLEALKAVKKYKKARFKAFNYFHEAADFAIHGCENPNNNTTIDGLLFQKPIESSTGPNVGEKPSQFRGPKSQDLVKLRKAIENGDINFVKNTIWENPKYLVSVGDTPSILQVRNYFGIYI